MAADRSGGHCNRRHYSCVFHGAAFAMKRIQYWIYWSTAPQQRRLVTGYAFKTPRWPTFHACVRQGDQWTEIKDGWTIDHFETGLSLSNAGRPKRKEEAPRMLARFLDVIGAERVAKGLERAGV